MTTMHALNRTDRPTDVSVLWNGNMESMDQLSLSPSPSVEESALAAARLCVAPRFGRATSSKFSSWTNRSKLPFRQGLSNGEILSYGYGVRICMVLITM